MMHDPNIWDNDEIKIEPVEPGSERGKKPVKPRSEKAKTSCGQVVKSLPTVPALASNQRDREADILLAMSLTYLHKFARNKMNYNGTDQGKQCADLEKRIREHFGMDKQRDDK